MSQTPRPVGNPVEDRRRDELLEALFTCEHGVEMCEGCTQRGRACARCPECKAAGVECREAVYRDEAKKEPKLRVIPGPGRCRYCGKRDLHWRKSRRGKNVLWEVYEDNYMAPVERPPFLHCPENPRRKG